ncbi:pentatricopeptide repeat-containing protein At3g18970 [Cornus florida]|uniref:pentatricopeptide repeat-containing protein At3g18970 n=1 Tax=Cornus florida TaxID=4283 RepID=UPI0028A274BA|nr:pentatricopeptide repeat-containing protein At3g18970 [Cornus florida]XP_059652774.1 pentatricopeptide repeat-containing protein At3g18970 [Cornus florida]XP_059652775.1 pentatricopeptide repeat-containing protein At3g18970 [Cornus florida]XP_059652776.1 pentatricopeptide repeat-containing protein At3g18970 [Cornus florida]XP_059652777.1 pentatricopeptide repeat-containing protein At3g18970 [Cornus florida]XP_059652778.1 pentatricopeptide repeat-containing protein At3g18970 [Cornus florida]
MKNGPLKMLTFFRSPRCLSFLLEKQTAINHLKEIHAQLIIDGLKSPRIFAKLIERYCAVSSPQGTNYAHLIPTQFHDQNVYLLNVLIRCTPPRSAILVFANWVSRAELNFDDSTYIFVLGACARSSPVSALWEGKQIHARIVKHGFLSNVFIQTTTIHFYARNKDVGSARKVFDEMDMRNIVACNAMMSGYCSQKERVKEYAYDALLLFRDVLVDVYGVEATDTTVLCVLSAASQLGVLETGVCVHGFVEKTICLPENDVFLGTGLVDMYSKCGCLDSAFCVFNRMKVKNVLTWTAMTTGLAIHGKGKEALELLDAMKANGVKPNAVTFTSLFSACCHAGLVEEGLHLFHSMESKFGVIPMIQHYGCIVDLLGRAGHLKEAYEFIVGIKFKRDLVLWRSLLNACKVHEDVVMGEKVGKLLLQAQHMQDIAGLAGSGEDYIALSNVYASAERWEDVEMVREVMKIKGIEFNPGGSSVYSLSSHL